MDTLLQDLRYSFRRLRQSPGFAFIAITIVGLGIGANSAIFSVVNAVLLRPQPYESPHELVNVYVSDSRGEEFVTTSRAEYRAMREQQDLFVGTVAIEPQIVSQETAEGAAVTFVEVVSANYWDVLGVRPLLGRGFLPDEEAGGAVVAVLNHQVWQREFGGAPDIIGRTVRLNGSPVTIVGVGPAEYGGVINAVATRFWLPLGSYNAIDPGRTADLEDRGSRSTFVRARMRPGMTVAQAQAGVDILMSRQAQEFPASNTGRKALVVSADGVRFHPAVDGLLYPVAGMLLLVVGLVLAIACSNIAGLLLARATSRQKEVALRLAVGAGRGRLVRQLLTESVLIGAIGGAVGLVVAWGILRLVVAFQPPIPFPIALDLTLDGRVLIFTGLLSIGTGLLFGLAPALRSTRPNLVQSLKGEGGAQAGRHRWFGLRNALVVVQVAVSVLLLAGAGLFVRSLGNAQGIDPGFEPERVALLTVSLDQGDDAEEANRAALNAYLDAVRGLPGVDRVALTDRVPLGLTMRTRGLWIANYPMPAGQDDLELDVGSASPGYFETMGIPLVAGREFTDADDRSGPAVAVVSEAAARRFWGRANVVGERMRFGGPDGEPLEIVGVARDVKIRTLGEAPRSFIYTPTGQESPEIITVVAGTIGDPTPVLDAMRRELRTLLPNVPVFDAKTMPQQLGVALFLPRIAAGLLGIFGALGLTLAVLGLYGVIAFTVAQRTREIGVRMALGARSSEVIRLVVRESVALVAVGLTVGILVALLATRPLAGVLVDVRPGDPLTLLGVAVVLAAAAVLASLIPARRAATVDPLIALRQQ